MYKHILIPTDGSDLSAKAVTEGVLLARSLNARITAVTSSPTIHTFQYEQECAAWAQRYLGEVEVAAKAAGVAYEGVHVVHDHPWEAIVDTAIEKGCDLILMASHGRTGLSALVIGSETAKVLAHSTIPTLVLRFPGPPSDVEPQEDIAEWQAVENVWFQLTLPEGMRFAGTLEVGTHRGPEADR